MDEMADPYGFPEGEGYGEGYGDYLQDAEILDRPDLFYPGTPSLP